MKYILLVFAFFISIYSFSQTIVQIDSIANVMCSNLIKYNEIKNDTLKLNTLYEKELYPYLGTLKESKVETIGQRIYYRLQRNCVEFRELLDRLDPPNEETKRMVEKPKSNISKKDLMDFKKTKDFTYSEVDGSITSVHIGNDLWIDNFSDGTYSKLTYNWINEYEFELIFIESNNETRANFSIEGDKLIYSILDKQKSYYVMSVNIFGQQIYEEFKLYF